MIYFIIYKTPISLAIRNKDIKILQLLLNNKKINISTQSILN